MVTGARLVAVYDSEPTAQRAADAARRAGAPPNEVRVGDPLDHVTSLQGEMHEELAHTHAGPGNVGPWTKEMAKGMLAGVVVGGAIGAVLALPFALIEFGDFATWIRFLVVAIVGALVGSTAGWVVGGGFGAKRPEEPLAAERGTTVTAPALEPVKHALMDSSPIRLDLVDAEGQAIETIDTEESETPGVAYDVGRNLATEERDN